MTRGEVHPTAESPVSSTHFLLGGLNMSHLPTSLHCINIISGKVPTNSYGPVFKPCKSSHWFPWWSRLNLEPVISHIKTKQKDGHCVTTRIDFIYHMYVYNYIHNIKPMPNQSGNGFSIFSKDVMADKVVTGCWACGKHGFPGTADLRRILGPPTVGIERFPMFIYFPDKTRTKPGHGSRDLWNIEIWCFWWMNIHKGFHNITK